LDRLCKFDKDFLHKDACVSAMAQSIREKMVLLQIDASATDASNADATGGEPIFKNGTGIGRVSSGTYGYSVGMSLAIGFVKNAEPGDTVDVMILGKPHSATILDRAPFDPDGVKLRS
jgi:dimethylglycine dehydrogenase